MEVSMRKAVVCTYEAPPEVLQALARQVAQEVQFSQALQVSHEVRPAHGGPWEEVVFRLEAQSKDLASLREREPHLDRALEAVRERMDQRVALYTTVHAILQAYGLVP